MRAGRAVLAAMAGVGLLVGVQVQSLAQAPAPPAASDKVAPKTKSDAPAPKPGRDESAPGTRLVSILGREVTNRDGDGGRVIDVLIDLNGGPGAVVVEFGGFMGIGSRKVAVEWTALRFTREGKQTSLIIDIGREQIRDAAEYKPNEPTTVLRTKTTETTE